MNFWELTPSAWQAWKLIPVTVEGVNAPLQPSETIVLGPPPLYDGNTTGRPSIHAQQVETERDEFGTIVNEVIVVTTTSTVTTRKRYRVEDA